VIHSRRKRTALSFCSVFQQNELLLDILERQERLEQQNKQLTSKLEEQQNYINNKIGTT
jgi:hypothetical protein